MLSVAFAVYDPVVPDTVWITFWAMFGESIASLYAKHLGPSLDPWLVKHVVPHYITVRDVVVDAARKTGLDKVGGFLSAVAAKESAMSQAKEL